METSKLDTKLLLFGIAVVNASGFFYVHDAIQGATGNGLSLPEIGLFAGFVVSLIGVTYGEGTADVESDDVSAAENE